jgi:hypothetical protein
MVISSLWLPDPSVSHWMSFLIKSGGRRFAPANKSPQVTEQAM